MLRLGWPLLFSTALLLSTSLGCTSCRKKSEALPDAGAAAVVPTVPDEPPVESAFEGTFRVEVVAMGDEEMDTLGSYAFTVKGRSLRWELPGSGPTHPYRIYRASERRFLTVLPAAETIVATPEDALRADAAAQPAVELVLVDKSGTFAGLPCERWSVTMPEFRYEMCLTRDVPPFPFELLPEPFAVAIPFNAALVERGFFPLVVTVRANAPEPKDAGRPRKSPVQNIAVRFHVMEARRNQVDIDRFRPPPFEVVTNALPILAHRQR